MTRRLTIVAHEVGAWANHRAATAELARAQGWDVRLLVGGKGDPVPLAARTTLAYDSLPMARGMGGPIEVWRSIRLLRQTMKSSDTVELLTLKPIVLGLFARRTVRRSKRPRVVATFAGLGTVLDDALGRRRHWLTTALRLVLNDAAAVLVENPDDATALIRAAVVREQNVVVGPGVGLPDDWLALDPNTTHARTNRSSPAVSAATAVPTTIVYVGRIIASKGVTDLIAALQLLRERGTVVHAILAGALDDRNPSAVSAETVARWQDDGLVEWIGHVNDLLPTYRRADIVVLPSHREGRPRSLMEAQALGIAVIATDVPGCRQVMIAGQTGLSVAPRDPVALALAIETLVTDPKLRSEFAANARIWAQSEFRSERFLALWASVVLPETSR